MTTAIDVAGLKNLPADVAELLRQQAEAMRERVSAPSGDFIRVTQAKTFKFPDGKETAEPFQAVIVDFVARNEMYEGTYNKNDIQPPICFSIGEKPSEMVPSPKSPEKQSEACSACPMNQWKSSGTGNGKACKNLRMLALLPIDAEADTPIWILKVSPTGIQAFDKYVTTLSAQTGLPPVGVITTIGFDPALDYGSLRFGNPSANPDIAKFVARQKEARERLLVEPDVTPKSEPSGKAKRR